MHLDPADTFHERTVVDGCDGVAGGLFKRPLDRILSLTNADVALLFKRRRDGHGFTRLGHVAGGPGTEAIARDAADFLMNHRSVDAISSDARILSYWCRSSSIGNFALILARRSSAPQFAANDLSRLLENVGWIEDLADLWWRDRRVVARLEGLRTVFGVSGTGALLLNARTEILEINAAARRMLEPAVGLLHVGNRLTASLADDARQLRDALLSAVIAAAAGRKPPPRQLQIARGPLQRPLNIVILQPGAATAIAADDQDPTILMLMVDPDVHVDIAPACSLYKLSPVQTRLAEKLVAGSTVKEAAALLQLSPETARSYLKEIFRRIGVKRQSELVTVLLNSVLPHQSAEYAGNGRASQSSARQRRLRRRSPDPARPPSDRLSLRHNLGSWSAAPSEQAVEVQLAMSLDA